MFSSQHDSLLKDQLEGQQLQTHARPKPHLRLSGVDFSHLVTPALYLSGDSLDYFTLPDGRLLAYLVDVSGSGTAAALMCMLIKSMVRHSVAMSRPLTAAMVLADVNRLLLEAGAGKHATMVCAIIDPAGHKLQWAHAGHTPRPIFFTTSSQLLTANGTPVGLFAGVDYSNHELELPERFSFVVCSDGIFDCLPQGSFAEREAMLVALVDAASGDFEQLCSGLQLAGRSKMPDDISVLVISRDSNE